MQGKSQSLLLKLAFYHPHPHACYPYGGLCTQRGVMAIWEFTAVANGDRVMTYGVASALLP
jgi:hypothetical protein